MWVKNLPSVQVIVPHRGGLILRCILKVKLLKLHGFGQIIMNLSQFRVFCYKFDVKLKLRFFTKALCKFQNVPCIFSSCWPLNECGVSFFEVFRRISQSYGCITDNPDSSNSKGVDNKVLGIK